MSSTAQEHSRALRLREYEASVAQAERAVAVMGALVRGREARGGTSEPAEVVFAGAADDEGRALPAAVWVALRRDDGPTVLGALTDASRSVFVLSRREQMGEGYRLETVEETRVLPDVDLLFGQLARVLDLPADLLEVLAQWGPDDPRVQSEIDELLDPRFGPPCEDRAAPGSDSAALRMPVHDLADVLQLTEGQAKVLATLVRRYGLHVTP